MKGKKHSPQQIVRKLPGRVHQLQATSNLCVKHAVPANPRRKLTGGAQRLPIKVSLSSDLPIGEGLIRLIRARNCLRHASVFRWLS